MSKKELKQFAQSVYFQANERMSFIKPEDHIISVLLFELGNAVKIIGENENAVQIYRKAKEYGFKEEIIDKRLDYCYQSRVNYGKTENQKKVESVNKKKENDIIWILIFVLAGILLAGLIIFYFKSKNSKKKESPIF